VALGEDPADPEALAYRGAIAAMRADRAKGLAEKMRLVGEAYRDLDAAVSGGPAAGRARLAALLCRASVSAAVPNEVFERAAQGAADFEAAAAIEAASGDAAAAALHLAGSALALEKAGRREEAMTRWATLAEKPGLPAAAGLLLLDRGLEPKGAD
jgi:hypothetical protein